jgi:hypothetical protein
MELREVHVEAQLGRGAPEAVADNFGVPAIAEVVWQPHNRKGVKRDKLGNLCQHNTSKYKTCILDIRRPSSKSKE